MPRKAISLRYAKLLIILCVIVGGLFVLAQLDLSPKDAKTRYPVVADVLQ